jgi:hypothetical protein
MNQRRFAPHPSPAPAGARAARWRCLAGAALLAGLALAGPPGQGASADVGGDLGDPQPLLTTPKISIDDVQAYEPPNGSGVATFTVRLDHRRVDGRTVTVQYHTLPVTAFAPGDFVATGGTLTWNPGDPLAQPLPVMIVDDGADGATTDAASFVEHYQVELFQAQNAVIAKGIGEGTIVDTDRQPPPPDDTCKRDPTAPECRLPLSTGGAPTAGVNAGPQPAVRLAEVTSGGEPTARPPITR